MSVPREIRGRYEKLKGAINRYRYLYHARDIEEISEEARSSLQHELALLEEKYPELIAPDSPSKRVGGEPLPEFKKIRHAVAQWSFNDAFTEEDMRDFDKRVKRFLKGDGVAKAPTSESEEVLRSTDRSEAEVLRSPRRMDPNVPTYTAELKIDGLKVVLTYEKGILATAATRGDGVVGEDVTHNVKTIESVPLVLERPINCVVEGEVWMSEENLKRINREQEKLGLPPFA